MKRKITNTLHGYGGYVTTEYRGTFLFNCFALTDEDAEVKLKNWMDTVLYKGECILDMSINKTGVQIGVSKF